MPVFLSNGTILVEDDKFIYLIYARLSNFKHGQKPDVAAQSMAKIIKAKLEDPFGKEVKK